MNKENNIANQLGNFMKISLKNSVSNKWITTINFSKIFKNVLALGNIRLSKCFITLNYRPVRETSLLYYIKKKYIKKNKK